MDTHDGSTPAGADEPSGLFDQSSRHTTERLGIGRCEHNRRTGKATTKLHGTSDTDIQKRRHGLSTLSSSKTELPAETDSSLEEPGVAVQIGDVNNCYPGRHQKHKTTRTLQSSKTLLS